MKTQISIFYLLSAIQLMGAPIQYTYDAAGRLIGVDYGGGTNTTYKYDNNGNLLQQATAASISADIGLTKSDAPDPVAAGSNLVYTIVITNNGPGTATDVTLADTLPFGVLLGSVQFSQGSCTVAGNTVSCDLGLLAQSATATVVVSVTPVIVGVFTNAAAISSSISDPVSANNTESETTTVIAAADTDTDGMPDWWELAYFGSLTNSPGADNDHDGTLNLDEYLADTDPESFGSVFVIDSISNQAGRVIRFGTSPVRRYGVQVLSNLVSGTWSGLATNLAGTGGELSVTDTNDPHQRTYRIQTGPP